MPLTFYEKKILEVFVESFPLSAHYREGRKLRKAGWQKIFPNTVADVEAKENFLLAVDMLCEKGIVSASWKRFRKGDELKALYLEDPDELYIVLRKSHPENTRKLMINRLKTRALKTDMERELVKYALSILSVKHPLPITCPEELDDILKLASLTKKEATQYPLRALSTYLFNDSKRIEKILRNADKLSERAAGIRISRELGLLRRFPAVTVAGNFQVEFKDGRVWQLLRDIVTLPLITCEKIKGISLKDGDAPKVLCVENKETFYISCTVLTDYDLFVYTGGHANTAVQKLLLLAGSAGGDVHHFGDLDPEGLLIFQELHKLLGGNIKPVFMTEAIYKKYITHSYELTETALERLKMVTVPEFLPLAELIKKHGVGIEQEVIGMF